MTSYNQDPQRLSNAHQAAHHPIPSQSPRPSRLSQQPGNAWTVPSRPMPAQQYSLKSAATLGPATQSQLQAPPYTQQWPRPVVPPHKQGTSRPRRRGPMLILLAVLAILITLGAIFGSSFFKGSSELNTPTASAASGPFVKPPLNAAQINAIMHLTGYMKYKQLASLYVSRMSLDEEIGQLIMVEYAESTYSSDLDYMINNLHAGGVIMYEFQMQTFNQTKNDIAEMQRRADLPLLISTDEEGGPYVHRLSNIYGYRISASDIAATGNPNFATQQGLKAAHDLLSLGINENLAPDVDVNLVNGYDMVTRSFGNTPQSVIEYAGAYMKGLQGAGVIACIKHFPGLGDAVTDAHTSLPVVNRTKDQIYSVELAPFKAFIQSPDRLLNPGMIMPTDVLMPAIDPVYPAELSHIFMTDILRKQFGYDGVVLTDALYMQGISQKWSMPEAAVLALNAGNDMLLGPTGTDQMVAMINGIKAALQNGTLLKSRIDEAATRIIALKMEDHLMPAIPPQI